MANNEREKIFKSWSGISELALIKEVATKGEHIGLCISYWARKRKMSVSDYELFFHDIVQTYVSRLLHERLVCKAEIVLRNVQRDVNCFYFQYACECNDPELRDLLLDHLRKKDPQNFEKEIHNLQFHWELLQKLKSSDAIMANIRKHMKRVHLESLMGLDSATQQQIIIELYFETRNESLLHSINKFIMWHFLVETKQTEEIIRWCKVQQQRNESYSFPFEFTALEEKYSQWPIETEMYEYAITTLTNNGDDVLRNYFAAAGFFFPDERTNVETVLRRISVTHSLDRNKEAIRSLNLGRFIFDHELYYMLLIDSVEARQIQEMTEEKSTESHFLKFLFALKAFSLNDLDGFKKVSHYLLNRIFSIFNCLY